MAVPGPQGNKIAYCLSLHQIRFQGRGVEMGVELAGIPHEKGGVQAAMAYLADAARKSPRLALGRI
jgi:hypothetical protein